MAVPREVLGDPWGSLGSSLGVLGVPGGIPGSTKNGGCSRGVSWDGPGRPYGCFWRYWAIIGSVLRRKNVVISEVLGGFLRCHVFKCFFVDI